MQLATSAGKSIVMIRGKPWAVIHPQLATQANQLIKLQKL
jgi:hypothetical protein